MDNGRESWIALNKLCGKVGLPKPVFVPAALERDHFMCEIPGLFHMTGSPNEAIGSCIDFAQGYEHRMVKEIKAEKEELRPIPMDRAGAIDYAANLAKEVIVDSGLGGPSDHSLLAQAILGLTMALVLEKE